MSVQNEIEQKLALFEPSFVSVENESHKHSVPANSETHFKVVLVSDQFESIRKVARHQLVYHALRAELAGPVHALALHLHTSTEWTGKAPVSPDCLGGGR
jgi:BolA protein